MSSNPSFEADNFDDLIAAVDSIDFPLDDQFDAEPPLLTVKATDPYIADITFDDGDEPTALQGARFNDADVVEQLEQINNLSTSSDAPSDLPLLFRKSAQSKLLPDSATIDTTSNRQGMAARDDDAAAPQATATPVQPPPLHTVNEPAAAQPAVEDPQDDFALAFAELDTLPVGSDADMQCGADAPPVPEASPSAAEVFIADVCFEQANETADVFAEAFDDIDSLPLSSEAGMVADEQTDLLLDGFDGQEQSVDFALKVCETSSTAAVNSGLNDDSVEHTPLAAAVAAQQHTDTVREDTASRAEQTADQHTVLAQTQDTTVDAYLNKPSYKKPAAKGIVLFLAQRMPGLYLAMTGLLALLGFAYVLMIPAMFGLSVYNAFEMLNNPFTTNTLMLMLAFFSISLFLFLVSYKLFDLSFVGPEGVALDENNAGLLLRKLQQLKKEQRVPKIHNIVLTRRHELNIIKVPRFGLPIWSKNVLAVGYPLLQTMTPDYFEAALSRRLMQYSKHRHMAVNWLSFMRRTWTLYAESLKQRNGVIDLVHYCFFAPYASLYRNFAVYMTQKDELIADELALLCSNDRDLVKGAQTIRITQAMLIQYFWPKLDDAIRNNLSSPANIRPYYNLPHTLADLLSSKDIDSWFIRLAQEKTNPRSPEAPFARRMERMGHRKVSVPKSFDFSAARYYFGDDYDNMTDRMDELWAKEVQQALFLENLKQQKNGVMLPFRLSIEPA